MVRKFGEFLDADAGQAKNCHSGPGPERTVLFGGEVAAPAGGGILGPDLRAGAVPGHHRPAQRLPGDGEHPSRGCGLGGQQDLGSRAACRVDGGDQDRQDGQPLPGPLIHPGFAV